MTNSNHDSALGNGMGWNMRQNGKRWDTMGLVKLEWKLMEQNETNGNGREQNKLEHNKTQQRE